MANAAGLPATTQRRGESLLGCMLLVVAASHLLLSAVARPMLQVSDELSYISAAQIGALEALPTDSPLRDAVVPGGVVSWPYVSAKLAFRQVAGLLLATLAAHMPLASALLVLRISFGLCNVASVYFTWRLARHVAPHDPLVAWGAPFFVALNPVYSAFGASVSPDALANPVSAAACWLLVRAGLGDGNRWDAPLGLLLAVAAFALKDTALVLLPWAVLAMLASLWQQSARGLWHRSGRVALMLTALLLAGAAAWKNGYQWMLPRIAYGHQGETLSIAGLGHTAVQAVELMVRQVPNFYHSSWADLGNFGTGGPSLPQAVITGGTVLVLLAAAGIVLLLSRKQEGPSGNGVHRHRRAVATVLVSGFFLALQAPLRQALFGGVDDFQGRWLFPLAGAATMCMCLGLSRLTKAPERWLPVLLLYLTAIWAAGWLGSVIPHYYQEFPAQVRNEALFLHASYGVGVPMEQLEPIVRRPDWATGSWTWAALLAVPLTTLAWLGVFLVGEHRVRCWPSLRGSATRVIG